MRRVRVGPTFETESDSKWYSDKELDGDQRDGNNTIFFSLIDIVRYYFLNRVTKEISVHGNAARKSSAMIIGHAINDEHTRPIFLAENKMAALWQYWANRMQKKEKKSVAEKLQTYSYPISWRKASFPPSNKVLIETWLREAHSRTAYFSLACVNIRNQY